MLTRLRSNIGWLNDTTQSFVFINFVQHTNFIEKLTSAGQMTAHSGGIRRQRGPWAGQCFPGLVRIKACDRAHHASPTCHPEASLHSIKNQRHFGLPHLQSSIVASSLADLSLASLRQIVFVCVLLHLPRHPVYLAGHVVC